MATPADPTNAADDAAADPQLYLQELSLQDCTCTPPICLPQWKRWNTKSNSGKRKAHPTHRGGHDSVWIASNGSSSSSSSSLGAVLLFGGSNRQAHTFADTWKFDLTSSEWSQPTLTGPSPPLRSGHSLVYDARRHRVLLYGGQQLIVSMSGEMEMKFLRDVWSLDCKTWSWSKLPDQGDAPQRNGHTAVLFSPTADSSATMVVFGGSDAAGPSDAVWTYGLESGRWTRVQTAGHSPEARELHAACVVSTADLSQQLMVISGGRGVSALLNTCYALRLPNSNGTAWEWNLVGQCPARCAHSMLPLCAPASAPVLPMLQSAGGAPGSAASASSSSSVCAAGPASVAIAASSTSAAATATATTATSVPSFPSSSSIPLLLFGGTDGSMFYNDVLCFALDPASLDPAAMAPPPACPSCQGPPGWTMLAKPDKPEQAPEPQPKDAEDAEDAEHVPASGAGADAASGTSTDKKKKRKKKRATGGGGGAEVQPPTCFAHTLTPLPCASPSFALPAADPASGAPLVPASFLLFGGLNDEADLDDTHALAFVPYSS